MDFRFAQEIAAPLEEVEESLCSSSFYAGLGTTGHVGSVEVLEREEAGRVVHLQLRMTYTGELPAAARVVVDPAKLSWVTHLVADRDAHQATFTFVPDHYPERLTCAGSYELVGGGDRTRREVAGRLSVRIPLLGASAARALVGGLRAHFDEQAALLAPGQPERS